MSAPGTIPREEKWSKGKKFFFLCTFCYVIIFINSFSFPHAFIPDTGKIFSPFFEKLARFSGENIFHPGRGAVYELVSDSAGMYIHAFNLVFISVFLAWIWMELDKRRENYASLFYWFCVIVRYYLALHMLSYGFNKVFKWQFYLPEPNTLYTPMGEVPRDLLYWSAMGTSRLYNIFMGITEVVAAALLLFRRTTMAGALLTLGIMVNVLFVNLSFNISVKLFSAFLILLCLILLVPRFKSLFHFFFAAGAPSVPQGYPVFSETKKMLYRAAKYTAIVFLFFSTLWEYARSGIFNDDKAPRPFLHGAYTVTLFVRNGDTLPPLLTDAYRWKRAFVHRRGYFIVQGMNDALSDLELKYDSLSPRLHLLNYIDSSKCSVHYRLLNDSTLQLSGNFFGSDLFVQMKKEDLSKLWLLQDEFDWTVHGE